MKDKGIADRQGNITKK